MQAKRPDRRRRQGGSRCVEAATASRRTLDANDELTLWRTAPTSSTSARGMQVRPSERPRPAWDAHAIAIRRPDVPIRPAACRHERPLIPCRACQNGAQAAAADSFRRWSPATPCACRSATASPANAGPAAPRVTRRAFRRRASPSPAAPRSSSATRTRTRRSAASTSVRNAVPPSSIPAAIPRT